MTSCFSFHRSVAWATAGRVTLVGDDGGGRSNLYSFDVADAVARAEARADGDSIGGIPVAATRHTARSDHCVRHAAPDAAAAPDADAVTIAYVSGGRLFTSVIGGTKGWGPVVGTEVSVRWSGSRAGCEGRAVDAEDYVDGWSIHPEGLTLLANVRGRMFSMGLWDGPALEYEPVSDDAGVPEVAGSIPADATPPGAPQLRELVRTHGARPRCRLGRYLWDGRRVAMVTDASGEDDVEIHSEDGDFYKRRLNLPAAVLGRVDELVPSPESPLIAVVNHRARLLVVDAETGKVSFFLPSYFRTHVWAISVTTCFVRRFAPPTFPTSPAASATWRGPRAVPGWRTRATTTRNGRGFES